MQSVLACEHMGVESLTEQLLSGESALRAVCGDPYVQQQCACRCTCIDSSQNRVELLAPQYEFTIKTRPFLSTLQNYTAFGGQQTISTPV